MITTNDDGQPLLGLELVEEWNLNIQSPQLNVIGIKFLLQQNIDQRKENLDGLFETNPWLERLELFTIL